MALGDFALPCAPSGYWAIRDMHFRRSLRRLHIWLAWAAGIPLLMWTVSGLWMVARPIEEVRGTALRAEAPTIALPTTLRAPVGPIKTLSLEQQGGRNVWIAIRPSGETFRSDPESGRRLGSVGAAEARTLAVAALVRPSRVEDVRLSSADKPPLELRRARPAWAVRFAGGNRVYIDADTGQILALRTPQWRAFDLMWGLHIMDLSEREDTSHAILIGSAALALIATLAGLILLPLSSKRRKRP